jgi:hypothetical protein
MIMSEQSTQENIVSIDTTPPASPHIRIKSLIDDSFYIKSSTTPIKTSKIIKKKIDSMDTTFSVRQRSYINTFTQPAIEYSKTRACTVFLEKGVCHRKVCGFAHCKKEINPNQCKFVNCNRQYQQNLRRGQTICIFKHTDENVDEWSNRIGLDLSGLPEETVIVKKVEPDLKCTRLCKKVLRGETCTITSCNFAHTRDEYRYPLCMNGDRCYKKTTCVFKHPDESEDDFNIRRNFEFPYSFPYSSWTDEFGEKRYMINVPPLTKN